MNDRKRITISGNVPIEVKTNVQKALQFLRDIHFLQRNLEVCNQRSEFSFYTVERRTTRLLSRTTRTVDEASSWGEGTSATQLERIFSASTVSPNLPRAAAISSHEALGVRFIHTPNNSALHRAGPWLEDCFSICARSFFGTPMYNPNMYQSVTSPVSS